jgi:hypothetical protein
MSTSMTTCWSEIAVTENTAAAAADNLNIYFRSTHIAREIITTPRLRLLLLRLPQSKHDQVPAGFPDQNERWKCASARARNEGPSLTRGTARCVSPRFWTVKCNQRFSLDATFRRAPFKGCILPLFNVLSFIHGVTFLNMTSLATNFPSQSWERSHTSFPLHSCELHQHS